MLTWAEPQIPMSKHNLRNFLRLKSFLNFFGCNTDFADQVEDSDLGRANGQDGGGYWTIQPLQRKLNLQDGGWNRRIHPRFVESRNDKNVRWTTFLRMHKLSKCSKKSVRLGKSAKSTKMPKFTQCDS